MKLLVIFLVSCVALTAASDLKTTAKNLAVSILNGTLKVPDEIVKAHLEKLIKKHGMTCENHAEVCDGMVAKHKKYLDDDESNDLVKKCVSIAKQYLCEGKKEGKLFENVKKEFVKLAFKVNSL